MKYDIERMKADINMPAVIKYICSSDEIHNAGSTMFCLCVSGIHKETQFNHNAVYEKKTHCYTCNENYDAFEFVKKYYEMKGVTLSFQEVCEKVGDALGGADMYVISGEYHKKEESLLSKEELEALRLSSYTNTYLLQISEEERKKLLRDRSREMMEKYKNLIALHPEFTDEFEEKLDIVRIINENNGGKREIKRLFH